MKFLRELKRARFYKNEGYLDNKVSYHTSLFVFMDMANLEQWNILSYLHSIHSIQLLKFPIDERQEVIAKSHLFSSYEASKYSSLSLSYQRLISHSTIFKLVAEGKWNVISLYSKIVHTLTDDIKMSLRYSFFGEKDPSLKIEKAIDDNSSASLSFNMGEKLILKSGYNRVNEKTAYDIFVESDTDSAAFNINTKALVKKNTFIGANMKFSLGQAKSLKKSVKHIFRSFGIDISGYVEKRFSRTTNLTLSFSISFNRVQISLALSRLNHYICIPFVISDIPTLSSTFISILAPTIFNFLYDFTIDKLSGSKKNNVNQKEQAKNFIEVMGEEIKKKQEEERNKQGLVILKAFYGNLPDHSDYELSETIIDITLPLQYMVKDSKLFLDESSKSNLMGSYDPCPSIPKSLEITYMFNNEIHKIKIKDNEQLKIPFNKIGM